MDSMKKIKKIIFIYIYSLIVKYKGININDFQKNIDLYKKRWKMFCRLETFYYLSLAKQKQQNIMKKQKKKQKFDKCCYNCKFRHHKTPCEKTFSVVVCEKFEYCSTLKSI
jgi:hypothetical protein